MKKWMKIVALIGILGIVTGGIIVYRIYTKPHRDVTKEQALTITADALYDAFKTNEEAANKQYLDKAVAVSGEVVAVSTNQDGKTVIDFKTADTFVVVNCTCKEKPGDVKEGDKITIKGICTGYIPDANVVINDGVREDRP
jgi:hypothetical protein